MFEETIPLDLAGVAKKIQVPKRRLRTRGSPLYFGLFLTVALGLFTLIVATVQQVDVFGAQQIALYLTGGMGFAFLAAFLMMPAMMWYSKAARLAYRNVTCGLTAIALMLSALMPQIEYPVWTNEVVLPVVKNYSFILPDDAEVDLLTRVVYGEARGESDVYQSLVVQTILNRAEHPGRRFPKHIRDILLEKYAYSCLIPSDPNYRKILDLPKDSLTYKRIRAIVINTINSRMNGEADATEGATHYHTDGVDPKWNTAATRMVKLGNHKFWVGVDG